MDGDSWAILPTATDHVKHRLYDGASLRHCCLLLAEIEQAAKQHLEMAVRILGRAHIEAWLFGLYLHFGGYPALERIAQDTHASTITTYEEFRSFDAQLRSDKRKAEKRLVAVRKTNDGRARWNTDNPDKSPKPMLDEPYVPRLRESGIDLASRIGDFAGLKPATLPVSVVVDALTKLAPKEGFGRESFRPVYQIYRLVSAVGPHPTLHLYDWYLCPGGFVRIAPEPGGPSMINPTRISALYSTAFLAEWVLSSSGCETPIATEVRQRYEANPDGSAGWAPGS